MDKIPVTKFNGTEYGLWKFQMAAFLDYHGLCQVTNGTTSRTEANSQNWDKLDKNAKYALTQSLELSQVRYILNCKNANEIWSRLETLYEQKNETSVHLLLAKFFEYKMDPDKMTVSEHVSHVEQMAQQLEDLGQKQSKTTIITKVLHSLPASFRGVITAWDSVAREQQTMENLLPRLLKEEQLAKSFGQLKIADNDESAALYAKGSKSTNYKKSKQTKKMFKGKCYNCNEYGHTSRQCKKPKRDMKYANNASNDKDCIFGDAYMASYKSNAERWSCKNNWLADSGASNHMTFRRDWFSTFIEINDKSVPITVGNNDIVYASGRGNIRIISTINGKQREGTLYNVLWIPKLGRNLFSIGASNKRDNKTIIEANKIKIINSKNQTIMEGYSCEQNLYAMDTEVVMSEREANYADSETRSLSVWHERLGHVSYKKLEQMVTSKMIKVRNLCDVNGNKEKFCEACIFGKQTRKQFNESDTRAVQPCELIHFDVCGPMSTQSLGGNSVSSIFVDDYTGFVIVRPMKNRMEILDAVEGVIAIANSHRHKIKRFRSDNAREFKSKDMRRIMNRNRIVHEFSTPHAPQQNGRAEQLLRLHVHYWLQGICRNPYGQKQLELLQS